MHKQPPRIYGQPKIHKPEIPLRPIVSCVNTFAYDLSVHLADILSPSTGKSDYTAGSGIHQNLGTGCGILLPVCREFGKSSRPKKPLWRQKRINQASAKYQSKGPIYSLNLLAFAEISLFYVFLGKKKRNSG